MVPRRATAALVAQLLLAPRRRADLAQQRVDRRRTTRLRRRWCAGRAFSGECRRTPENSDSLRFSSLRRQFLLPLARRDAAAKRQRRRFASGGAVGAGASAQGVQPGVGQGDWPGPSAGAHRQGRSVAERPLVSARRALPTGAGGLAAGLSLAAGVATLGESGGISIHSCPRPESGVPAAA
ncbi:hypothetical protein D3C81_1394620 [compost metagenome]